MALYKGFFPNWLRLGPWNIIVSFFLPCHERMSRCMYWFQSVVVYILGRWLMWLRFPFEPFHFGMLSDTRFVRGGSRKC